MRLAAYETAGGACSKIDAPRKDAETHVGVRIRRFCIGIAGHGRTVSGVASLRGQVPISSKVTAH